MNNRFNYSIVIPFRDSIEQLSIALKSIPDREDIQVIVVDNSKVLFDKDQYPKYNKVQLTIASSKYGAGAGCARNVGLKLVRGQWLIFLDADDYFTNNAFDAFDNYIQTEYDIVFFKADSINLETGKESHRHIGINRSIDHYLSTNNEDFLRYQFSNPVCKMIRSSLVKENNILFEEIKCSNDSMFSVRSGHMASTITADKASVYVITESPSGVSLTTDKSKENSFIRFQVATRRYTFLKSIGKSYLKPKFASFIINALIKFGPSEALKYIKYYLDNK